MFPYAQKVRILVRRRLIVSQRLRRPRQPVNCLKPARSSLQCRGNRSRASAGRCISSNIMPYSSCARHLRGVCPGFGPSPSAMKGLAGCMLAADQPAIAFFARTVLRECVRESRSGACMISDSREVLIPGMAGCCVRIAFWLGRFASNNRLYRPPFITAVVLASTIVVSPSGAWAQASNRAASGRDGTAAVTLANSRTPVQISDGARTAADAMFGDRCAVCHGPEGDGKGPGSANLNPKPIDFRDRKWQRSITDATIAKAIVYGGPAVGLSASMSANPDLEAQPDVVAALIERIRKLGAR